MIIFSERCELKKVPENTKEYIILKRPELLNRMRNLLSDREIIYSEKEIERLSERLRQNMNVNQNVKQEHIEQIKKDTTGDDCPFCGKKLVERNGKWGKFLGCSGYPNCKYTRKLKD